MKGRPDAHSDLPEEGEQAATRTGNLYFSSGARGLSLAHPQFPAPKSSFPALSRSPPVLVHDPRSDPEANKECFSQNISTQSNTEFCIKLQEVQDILRSKGPHVKN